jgi:very-short-patch-repair endonuclease
VIDDLLLRQLAATQHGLVAVSQSEDLGLDRDDRRWLIDGRRWDRPTPRVLRLIGTPATIAQKAMLAVLDAGSGGALASTSAGAWCGIPGNLLEPFEVHRARGHVKRPHRSARRHESVFLPEHHVVVLDNVPTVVPARALFEIAGTRRRGAEIPAWVDRMARMVDAAWSLRIVNGDTLHNMLDDLAQRGRPGIRVMRQVLAERPRDYVAPASGLESRLMQILERSGHPPMRRQVDVGNAAGWIGRVDFRAEDVPLIVEVQSERFHASRIDEQLDATRIDRLEQAGFVVVEVTDVEVWHRPEVVLARIAEGRRMARKAA